MHWNPVYKSKIPYYNKSLIINKRAVSVVVSTILTLAIITTAVTTIMLWGMPYIEERKMDAQSEKAINSMLISSNTLKDLLIDGEDSTGVSTIQIDNKQGSFNVNNNGDKFILWYSFNKDYSFDVSDLIDLDDSFNITMDDHETVTIDNLDAITVYCLDPYELKETTQSEYLFIEPLYSSNHFAQSFTVKGSTEHRTLDKISLYMNKRGNPTDLNISIYNDSISSPVGSIDNYILSKYVSSEDIKESLSWIEVDVSDKNLNVGEKYYVVLNTSGGCYDYDSSCYSYYSIRPYLSSPYVGETAYRSYDSGNSWSSPFSDYDFPMKLVYSDNNSPKKAEFNLDYFGANYSGIDIDFKVTSSDSEGDNVYYYINWGDKTESDWIGPHASDNIIDVSHKWNTSGEYTIEIKCKDEYDNIAEDNSTIINIKVGNNLPLDYNPSKGIEELTRTNDQGTKLIYDSILNKVQVKLTNINDFSRTIRIDLYDDDYDPFSNPIIKGEIPFGRIWVFDLGYVKINLPFQIGNHITYFTNGCVLTSSANNYRLKNDPIFFENKDALSMRFIQLDKYSTGGGGTGESRIRLKMKKDFYREKGLNRAYNIKMQVFGPNQEAWLNYLSRNYNFQFYSSDNKIFYINKNDLGKIFILHNSFVKIDLGGY